MKTKRSWWLLKTLPHLSTSLFGAAAGTLLLKLASKAIVLLSSVLLARWLGTVGYGVYATTTAIVSVFSILCALGLPNLLVRLTASYQVLEQWGLMKGLLLRANVAVLTLSVAVSAVGLAITWCLRDGMGQLSTETLLWASVLLPVTTLGLLLSATLRGLRHVLLAQLPESIITPLVFVGLASAVWLAEVTFTSGGALALRFISVAISFGVGVWLLFGKLPHPMRHAIPVYQTRAWAQSAGPFLLLAGINMVNTESDVLMLSMLQGSGEAGIYRAASRGAELVALSLVVFNMVVQPTIARAHAAGETQRLQRLLTIGTRGALTTALPVTIILIIYREPILGSVFGQEFEKGADCLMILCLAQLANVAFGSVGQVLNMTGHERDAALGMAIAAGTNISFNMILIPKYGEIGAAVATAISLVMWNVLLAAKVKRRLALVPGPIGPLR